MCPACLSTVALGVAATTSAGGLAALVAKVRRNHRRKAKETRR
jgi:hypothetical protein